MTELLIRDGSSVNVFGGQRSELNDGPFGVADWAELLVLVEIQWGGSHGSSYWPWQGTYHFRHSGNDAFRAISETPRGGSTDYDLLSISRDANPSSLPIQATIASHTECTPFEQPQFVVEAFEIDKGDTWAGSLIAALSSPAAGGGVPGALVKAAVAAGLTGLNANDPLTVHQGSAPDPAPANEAYAVIDFRTTSATLPVTTGCGAAVEPRTALLAPPISPDAGYVAIPTQYVGTVSDAYFTADLLPAYYAAAETTANDHLLQQAQLMERTGVDRYHEFGRNALYAALRYEALEDILVDLDVLPFEESEFSVLDFDVRRDMARKTVVGMGYLAAAFSWAEASVREVDPAVFELAEAYFLLAEQHLEEGDHVAALHNYRDATCFFMKLLYPPFNAQVQPPPGDTRVVSRGPKGNVGNGDAGQPSLNQTGDLLAFVSAADNLVPSDGNGVSDVFVRNRVDGSFYLASVHSLGMPGNGPCFTPFLAPGTGVVVFASAADNLVEGDGNGATDVFVHDLETRRTDCLSLNGLGLTGNGHSTDPTVSADGRWVAFSSRAGDLVPNDTNGVSDVFLYDRMNETTRRVNVSTNGTPASHGDSYQPYLAAHGRYLAFVSDADNLVPGDSNLGPDVFVKDLISGAIERVSVTSLGQQSHAGLTGAPSLSADGQRVAFESDAPDLVAGVTIEQIHVFLHTRQGGETRLISKHTNGVPGDGDHLNPRISGDGEYVVFSSDSANLSTQDAPDFRDVFLYEAASNNLRVLSLGPADQAGNDDSGIFGNGLAITHSGDVVVFESLASNLVEGDNNGAQDVMIWTSPGILSVGGLGGLSIPADSVSQFPHVSRDGRYMVFASEASNLVQDDTNAFWDVFFYDRLSDEIILVSTNRAGGQGNGDSKDPAMSSDGRYLVFASSAEDLVEDDANGFSDIFWLDRLTGDLRLVTHSSSETGANGPSMNPSVNSDGRYVAFTSSASNLVAVDTNLYLDVFVVDLVSNRTTMVSLADSTNIQGDGDSGEPRMSGEGRFISGNGRFVGFASMAENLVATDTNDFPDVFLRDWVAERTYLVSCRADGYSGNEGSGLPSLATDGRYVAFTSEAEDLDPADANGARDVFVWSLDGSNATLASRGDVGQAGDNGSGYDGLSLCTEHRALAFSSQATNLVADDVNEASDLFVRELPGGATRRESLDAGDQELPSYSYGPSLSNAGSWLGFEYDRPRHFGQPGAVRHVMLRRTDSLPAEIPLLIGGLRRVAGVSEMAVTWTSRPNETYDLYGADVLGEWSPLETGILSQGSLTTWSNAIPFGMQGTRFLHVRKP